MTEVAIRPGASRHGATTGGKNDPRSLVARHTTAWTTVGPRSDHGRTTVERCAYTPVTYPNVCGPHRANRGANINHAALYPSVWLYRGCFTHACIYVHAGSRAAPLRAQRASRLAPHAIRLTHRTILLSPFLFPFRYFFPSSSAFSTVSPESGSSAAC